MELNLARDMKGVEKERRKTRGILVPLLNEGRHLVARGTEKATALNAPFKTILQESQDSDTRGNIWSKESFPWCRNYQV